MKKTRRTPKRSSRRDGAAGQVDVFALLSHEIRTPLNGVLGMAGLLASTPLDPTQSAYLQTLRDCGEHLLGLVNDVLDLAKLQSSHIELEPVPTDLEALLQGVCELLSPRAHEKRIEIGWAVQGGAPTLLADDGRLRQILFNLIGNAVKMTVEGGVLATVEVRDRPAPDRVRVRFAVEDTGPGVGADETRRIFQPFVQAKDGERAGGAGLGLAVVKRLADAFDGEVGVEPAEAIGARFWFEADFATVTEPRPRDRAPLSGTKVAVLTASTVLRRAARLQLEASGAQAVGTAEAADAVLLDGHGEPPDVAADAPPTLVMLAAEDRAAIPGLRAKGYAGYLIKPLRRVSLADRLDAVLGGSRRARAAASRASAPRDDREAGPVSGRGLRVLLVEDNAVNALLASALLGRRGCTVARVGSGAEAVAAVAGAPFDLVLMDMRMPGMSGLEATRTMRAAGCRVPVVALTANAFDDDRRACLEAGMDGFLTKPLDPVALDAALMRIQPAAA